MQLRPYQQNTLNEIYAWFEASHSGNLVVVLPTGAGKSVIIAALVRDALQNWPETRVLMLTHVKELIEQNAEKMLEVWHDAPVGIFSASIGRKQADKPITFAGIQSIHKHASKIGHVDLVLVDECHLINHGEAGTYRKFLAELTAINPYLRIIGLTATPYRLGHGYITEGEDALFDDLIEPTSIEQLVADGYLAPLRSKHTDARIDTAGVHKRGGEFIAGELEAAALKCTGGIAAETVKRAEHCKSILVFASGVNHAYALAAQFNEYGWPAACITGATPKGEREDLIEQFKAGTLRVLTNANVLTTGFNHPDIDCLVMARPTMSPGLYVQMAGRGMRLKSHTDHCLVLDFAGCVATHGPITAVVPPGKKGKGDGDAPIKNCPECLELIHLSVMVCPACGYQFPAKGPEKKKATLHDDDIMGMDKMREMKVEAWQWSVHTSKQSGKLMLKVRYYGGFDAPIVTEYLPVTHEGYAGDKARGLLARLANESRAETLPELISGTAETMNKAMPPAFIAYKVDGKFFRVDRREWKR